MIEIVPYNSEQKAEWDAVVEQSRNGTFLLKRDYMDYHADRFVDHSFVFRKHGKPVAVLPANIHDGMLYSHQGLTYGGLIVTDGVSMQDVLEIFAAIQDAARGAGCRGILYKRIPWIYSRIPSEEDSYALFRNDATLLGRNCASVVAANARIPFNESRKSGIRKALRSEITVCESRTFDQFWAVLEENLQVRHEARPVHELAEIMRLQQAFPEQIRLHTAMLSGRMIAGIVLYVTPRVAHVQYIATSDEGRRTGALDLLFDRLLHDVYLDMPYFDFGTSNGDMGRQLNDALIFQKEGFGGRTVAYDIYRWDFKP